MTTNTTAETIALATAADVAVNRVFGQQDVAATSSPAFSAFKADSSISFIRPYDAKAPAIPGYTHHAITYRSTKGVSAAPAKMVTLPSVSFPADWIMSEDARTVLTRSIEEWQRNQVKGLIEDKQSTVKWDSVDAMLALTSLTSITAGDYLTKESILSWFNEALIDAVIERGEQLAASKGLDPEATKAQIARTTNWYRDNISKLASKVPSLPMETCEKLQAFISPFGDSMAIRLNRILTKWLNPVVAAGLDDC